MPDSTYSKKKSFHLLEGTMNFFENWKGQKWKKPLKISKFRFFINRSQIFIALTKFYVTHRNYEILSKSLVPNAGEVLLLFAHCTASVRITAVYCITSVCATVLRGVFRNYCVLVYVEETPAHHYGAIEGNFPQQTNVGGISAENWRIFTSCARTRVATTPQPPFEGAVSRELVFLFYM
jgi:hypothetical protein